MRKVILYVGIICMVENVCVFRVLNFKKRNLSRLYSNIVPSYIFRTCFMFLSITNYEGIRSEPKALLFPSKSVKNSNFHLETHSQLKLLFFLLHKRK